MSSNLDLTGKRFGRLTVIEDSGYRTNRKGVIWHCVCDCGNHKYVPTTYLTSGDTRSCGCLFKETSKQPKTLTHGDSIKTSKYARLYRTWMGMRVRCDDPNNDSYDSYGGRGITYCDEWRHYEPFRDWALKNGYDDELTIDRIDTNGNYEPSNCRWSDAVTQSNNRRSNRRIEYAGETHTVSEWSGITGISDDTILHRLKYGWDVGKALTEPIRHRKPSREHIEYNGEAHSIAEWSKIIGISYGALVQRFGAGWSAEEAFTTPLGRRR